MKNILNKIAQMERNASEIKLASHNIELANASDVLKFTQEIRDIQAKLGKAEDAFNVAKGNVEKQTQVLKNQVVKSESLISELTKKVNELGIDIKSIDGIDRLIYEINSSKNNYLK